MKFSRREEFEEKDGEKFEEQWQDKFFFFVFRCTCQSRWGSYEFVQMKQLLFCVFGSKDLASALFF